MARYNKANDMADTAASQPFQKYGDDPSAFVAQMNATQTGAQQGITDAQGMYRPYFDAAGSTLNRGEDLGAAAGDMASGWTQGATQYGQKAIADATQTGLGAAAMGQQYRGAATDYTMAGGQAVNPTGLGAAQIGQYMSPFQDSVISSTMGNLRQQQQQEQSAMSGDAIKAGAFGGDRAGIAKANLARQQNLASGQVLSGLNQANYGQALGAAQGQQQVGLGAAQANRAATQQTGQSLAALGQQGYDQGLGAASFQNQMGQTFFNQGTQAAQQLNQIGQTGWERASQLSQAQAGLGSGAQAAELAGRQAQMGAGTVQQQTDQAGKQAMYNQFLQQQGYPFQTAQFLANIAMGTGALSGSTTNQTSPAPFFSDKRLKEGAQIIGKTFDGQPIYKFRYKGSPNTHVGLMAQDVEKKHPYSVGLAGGYKTVDYDSATKKAAERGHFADGGLALPRRAYADGGDAMAALLELHKAMYPYGSEGAGRTGGGTGPHGMALSPLGSYKLSQPAKIDAPKTNTLHDAVTMGDDVSKVVDAGEKVYDKATGTDPDGWKKDEDHYLDKGDNSGPELYRGGLARARMGAGGMPYSEADNEYVPEDEDKPTHPQLATPGKVDPGHPENALSDAKDIAKIAMMFMNRGGRAGYATDGAVDDDFPADSAEDEWLPPVRSLGDDPYGPYGSGDRGPRHDPVPPRADISGGLATADKAIMEHVNKVPFTRDLAKSGETLGGLGRAAYDKVAGGLNWAKRNVEDPALHYFTGTDPSKTPTPYEIAHPEPEPAAPKAAPPPASAAPPATGLGAAAAPSFSHDPRMADDAETRAGDLDHKLDVPGLPSKGGLGAADLGSSPLPGERSTTAPTRSTKSGDWMSRNHQWLVPLLKGVGTMAASPSRYLQGALLQGAGAAAGSYEDVQNQIQKRENQQVSNDVNLSGIAPAKGMVVRKDANGHVMRNPDGTPMYVPMTVGDGTSDQLGPTQMAPHQTPVVARYDAERKRYTTDVAPSDGALKNLEQYGVKAGGNPIQNSVKVHMNQSLGAQDDSEKARVAERTAPQNDFENQHYDLLNLAGAALDPARKGIMASGTPHEKAAPFVSMITWAYRAMGQEPPPDLQNAVTADDIVNKVTTSAGIRAASAAGQHRGDIAQALIAALPSGGLTPDAARKMAVGLLRANQQERDFVPYARNYAAKTGVALGTQDSFRNDMTPVLEKEGHKIDYLMQAPGPEGPSGDSMFNWIIKHRADMSEKSKQRLAAAYGPEVLRWMNVQ